MGRILPLVLGGLLLVPHLCLAQWSVLDASNLLQNTTTALNAVKTAANTAESVIAQYNMVRNQIIEIETMVRNLQRIPEGLNMLDAVSLWSQQLDGLLGAANGVSFNLSQAISQFDALYRQPVALTPQALLTQRATLLKGRLEASATAVQMQAVRTNIGNLLTRLCALLGGSWTTKGNLDSQQIAAQQRALLIQAQQAQMAMLAASARVEAQRQAEEVLLAQQALDFHRQALTLAPIGDWRSGPQLDIEIPPERR